MLKVETGSALAFDNYLSIVGNFYSFVFDWDNGLVAFATVGTGDKVEDCSSIYENATWSIIKSTCVIERFRMELGFAESVERIFRGIGVLVIALLLFLEERFDLK